MRESCSEASACNINVALFKAMDAARATNRCNKVQCSAIQSSILELLCSLLAYFFSNFLELLNLSFALLPFHNSFFFFLFSLRYLTEAEPWKMKGENESRRPAIVRTTLEALYAFTHLLAPVLPIAAQIGTNMLTMMWCSHYLI